MDNIAQLSSRKERERRAILSEFFPEWRTALSLQPSVWVDAWKERTGDSTATAWRWYHIADAIATAELLAAA